MAGNARSGTAAWVPSGPTVRPFRFGEQHVPDPDPELAAGTLIGERYRIVRLLGSGGMGRVYEAEHTFLGRRCALKLLRRDALRQPESVMRFRQEAMAASKIGHPGIVEVIDFATLADGQVFMVMEMLAGESLESRMERPGNLAEYLPRLVEVAEALDAAHRAGVMHRDIKPANIFLARRHDGSVHSKLLDFGIAKMTDHASTDFQTEAGSVLGTPYYLAPERAVGKAMDGRADLYSVGVILYELLTGNVPFDAPSFMEILGRHVKSEALDPRQAAPDRGIPDRVAGLAMRLLAKDPNSRPRSAAELAEQFQELGDAQGAALAAVVTGHRDLQADEGDATQVLEQVSERATVVPEPRGAASNGRSAGRSGGPVIAGPMTGFAEAELGGPAQGNELAEGYEQESFSASESGDAFAEPEPQRGAGWLLLIAFAVVGAAGGLAYLEFASADRSDASPASGASTTPGAEGGAAPSLGSAASGETGNSGLPGPTESEKTPAEASTADTAPPESPETKSAPADAKKHASGSTKKQGKGRPKAANGGSKPKPTKEEAAPTPKPKPPTPDGPTIKEDDLWDD